MTAHRSTSTRAYFTAASTRVRRRVRVASTTPARAALPHPTVGSAHPWSPAGPRHLPTACLRRSNPHRRMLRSSNPFFVYVAAVVSGPHPRAVAPRRHTKNALRLRHNGQGAFFSPAPVERSAGDLIQYDVDVGGVDRVHVDRVRLRQALHRTHDNIPRFVQPGFPSSARDTAPCTNSRVSGR